MDNIENRMQRISDPIETKLMEKCMNYLEQEIPLCDIVFDDSSKKIISLFNQNKTLGYKYLGYFTNRVNTDKLGTIEDSFQFILDNTVDEIYCSLKELNTTTIAKIRSFSNSNNIIFLLYGALLFILISECKPSVMLFNVNDEER